MNTLTMKILKQKRKNLQTDQGVWSKMRLTVSIECNWLFN